MRATRVCNVPGCPAPETYRGKCQACASSSERARGTPQQRGYTPQHQQLRRRWAVRVRHGGVLCARCAQPIAPGTAWDLGHTDDRTAWTGPEHAACNRAAGGRSAHGKYDT